MVEKVGLEYALECAGSRDSTTDRIVSQSRAVHPSKLNLVNFGHTQVCIVGGEARFCTRREHESGLTELVAHLEKAGRSVLYINKFQRC